MDHVIHVGLIKYLIQVRLIVWSLYALIGILFYSMDHVKNAHILKTWALSIYVKNQHVKFERKLLKMENVSHVQTILLLQIMELDVCYQLVTQDIKY